MLVLVIAFGHYEADEYGTMNQWLVERRAQAVPA